MFVCWKKINPENALDVVETHYCKWLYSETWTKIWVHVYNYWFWGVILYTCIQNLSQFKILRIVDLNKKYCSSLEIIVGGGVFTGIWILSNLSWWALWPPGSVLFIHYFHFCMHFRYIHSTQIWWVYVVMQQDVVVLTFKTYHIDKRTGSFE